MKERKLNNISDLRVEVSNVFMELRARTIDVHEAATLAKLADTMITSSKVELDYHKFSNTPSKIEFLETKNSIGHKETQLIEVKPLKVKNKS
jgi:hypothetical protein